MNTVKKVLSKICNIASTIVVVLVVILAFALVGVRLIGFNVYTVLSGSMEPEIKTGSIIYVKSIDYKELKEGDIITYMIADNTVVTHRIIEVIPDEENPDVIRFATKGDANLSPDGGDPVHYKNVIGKQVFTIPYLGYVSDYITSPPGTYVTIAGCAILLLLVFVPGMLKDDTPPAKKEEEQASAPAQTDDSQTGE